MRMRRFGRKTAVAWVAPLIVAAAGCSVPPPSVWEGDLVLTDGVSRSSFSKVLIIEGSLIVRNTSYAQLAFPALRGLTGDLILEDNERLESLAGLDALRWVEGDVRVTGNASLPHLAGMNRLVAVGGNLEIVGNQGMETLDGLEALVAVEGILRLGSNPKLSHLFALRSLRRVGGGADLGFHRLLPAPEGLPLDPVPFRDELQGGGAGYSPKGTGMASGVPRKRWPRMVPGRTFVEGPLDRSSAAKVIVENRKDLLSCYTSVLEDAPNTEGKIVFSWTATADGRVMRIQLEDDTVGKGVADCMRRKIRRWKFPETSGETRVRYPWLLRNN